MLISPFLDYLWNCQEDRGLKNASREGKKKKGASANDWLKPVVAGQNQGFQLQATETNSDRFKKKEFLKKLLNNHWEGWKTGSENTRAGNSGSYLRPQVQSQPRKSEMRVPLLPLLSAAPRLPPSLSSALETMGSGNLDIFVALQPPRERILQCPTLLVPITSDSFWSKSTWLAKSWLYVHVLAAKGTRLF